ncbi:MAG: 23S rRNA (uracil(1939)-C(5))-methyltransferase RlmD, partial [Lachnospiraceae bacterium]|nr:23S rRNA (uracil(1939)-C(5))-methyltransferase RlmD [Lachnospiraceae bacterium]
TDGEGIGQANGMAFYVKGTAVGDVILAGVTKLKKNYGYARIVRMIKPSPDRVEPACPIASRCGGCTLQHISYAAQLKLKQKKVFDALNRLGGIEAERFIFDTDGEDGYDRDGSGFYGAAGEDGNGENAGWARYTIGEEGNVRNSIRFYNIIGMDAPFHYRNKGQFPVGNDKNGNTVCGFYAAHSHDIVDTGSCLLQHEITDALMAAVREYMAENNIKNPIIRHVLTRVGFTTHEIMVCIVIAADKLPHAESLVAHLSGAVEEYNRAHNADYCLNSVSFNINKENTNVILGEKVVTIAGLPFITDYIGNTQYRISPLSFYQVNPVQTEELYATALEFTDPAPEDTVWDLYCGIGTISLYFAPYVKQVYGIEIVPQAIEDAKENAKLNGITNADFYCGAAEELFPKLLAETGAETPNLAETGREIRDLTEQGRQTPDIVVVDPPRKGCDASLIECLGNLSPRKIVYVSCDPATLARDIKLLGGYGYHLIKVQPVDMFPQTYHCESIALLQRMSNTRKATITLDVEMEEYHRIMGDRTDD